MASANVRPQHQRLDRGPWTTPPGRHCTCNPIRSAASLLGAELKGICLPTEEKVGSQGGSTLSSLLQGWCVGWFGLAELGNGGAGQEGEVGLSSY